MDKFNYLLTSAHFDSDSRMIDLIHAQAPDRLGWRKDSEKGHIIVINSSGQYGIMWSGGTELNHSIYTPTRPGEILDYMLAAEKIHTWLELDPGKIEHRSLKKLKSVPIDYSRHAAVVHRRYENIFKDISRVLGVEPVHLSDIDWI